VMKALGIQGNAAVYQGPLRLLLHNSRVQRTPIAQARFDAVDAQNR
jgi:hypothetical protein